MIHFPKRLCYSEKFTDENYEYRQVTLPEEIFKNIPKGRLLEEHEWRSLGIQQSEGWVHFDIFDPEPHVLLFRRRRAAEVPSV